MKRTRISRSFFVVVSTLFIAALAILAMGARKTRESKTEFKPRRDMEWGIYQMLTRRVSWGEQLDVEIETLGGQPRLTLFFRDISPRRGYPAETVKMATERGLKPIISWELTEWGRRGEKGFLKVICEGGYDNYFRDWARAAAVDDKELYLRFGFEMNGDWFGWGEQPEAFRVAWRRVWSIFQEEKAINVKWMFSPNVLWGQRSFEADILPYWPGDDVVDVVGLDGYNFGDNHSEWHSWQSYEDVFEESIRKVSLLKKPVYLSEVGCADDPRKEQWLKAFLLSVSADKRVRGFVYFQHNNPRKGEPNWRLDSDADSLAVFQEWSAQTGTEE